MKLMLFSLPTSKEGITVETFGGGKEESLLGRLLADPSERTSWDCHRSEDCS